MILNKNKNRYESSQYMEKKRIDQQQQRRHSINPFRVQEKAILWSNTKTKMNEEQ
jgi:hypothetical protein